MAVVPTEMTFNTTSTVMTSQRDNTMRHDNALPFTCHSRCASRRTMHMSYRSKTYTWNDVIFVKRSMIRVFIILYMYMFRAISCSSSGGQIVLIQHLVSSLYGIVTY